VLPKTLSLSTTFNHSLTTHKLTTTRRPMCGTVYRPLLTVLRPVTRWLSSAPKSANRQVQVLKEPMSPRRSGAAPTCFVGMG